LTEKKIRNGLHTELRQRLFWYSSKQNDRVRHMSVELRPRAYATSYLGIYTLPKFPRIVPQP